MKPTNFGPLNDKFKISEALKYAAKLQRRLNIQEQNIGIMFNRLLLYEERDEIEDRLYKE